MPNQTMIDAYKKLYGVTDDAQAEAGIRAHMSKMMEIRQRAQARSNDEFSVDDLFSGGFANFCEDQLKVVWTKNLMNRINGQELNRNTAQVTDEFAEYMTGLSEMLIQRGVIDVGPSMNSILDEGLDEELDSGEELREGEYKGWQNQWKHDILDKVPTAKTEVKQFAFYGRNLETDRKPSVKEALERARAEVGAACESVNGDNAQEKCAKAVLALRAVEEKHASRSGWWKFFHPINNSREKRAIREMQEQVRGAFTEEQIEAAQAQANGDATWVTEEKGDLMLSYNSKDMKIDPLESEEQTRQRAEQEIIDTQEEKEELSEIGKAIQEKEAEIILDFDDTEIDMEGDTVNVLNADSDFDRVREKEGTLSMRRDDYAGEVELDESFDLSDKESIFVPEAEECSPIEKSESSKEKEAPDLGKNLK